MRCCCFPLRIRLCVEAIDVPLREPPPRIIASLAEGDGGIERTGEHSFRPRAWICTVFVPCIYERLAAGVLSFFLPFLPFLPFFPLPLLAFAPPRFIV